MGLNTNVLGFLAIIFSFAVLGCGCQANDNKPEIMYDYASRLKTIASGVDGLVKFGDGQSLSNEELLLKAVNGKNELLQFPEGYSLSVRVIGNNSEVMLCSNERALIEDTGCTAKSDLHHWQAETAVSCDFTLNLSDLCH
ncbi:hypothetical protein RJP56_17625 [Shewanella baltica]|uniref:hypothetical protein n=1 Tax=Shewanella TaxID=22 RepID=UPI0021DB3FCF|nr:MULTISPECIES: hypothetical protein [Shewanella]MCU8024391.1 hypothetical protein [Shewanella sp. SM78]MDR9767881.1 hypothetical protein [Shewanella baltica]